jgi:hypothetical protein
MQARPGHLTAVSSESRLGGRHDDNYYPPELPSF